MEENVFRILIVDDEQYIREMISRHFRFLGYETEIAENGIQALEIMEDKRCDIVISDISMPEMDGIELLKKLKERHPLTVVIMITGYITLNNILNCVRYGAKTCVFKPIEDLSELETEVESGKEHINKWLGKLKGLLNIKPEI